MFFVHDIWILHMKWSRKHKAIYMHKYCCWFILWFPHLWYNYCILRWWRILSDADLVWALLTFMIIFIWSNDIYLILSVLRTCRVTTKCKHVIYNNAVYFKFLRVTVRRKCEGKFLPRTGHEGPVGKWRYSSTLSLTSALVKGGWLKPRPDRVIPGKENWDP
jgi:hypothetical protein